MKRILAIVMVVALCIGMASCGKKDIDTSEKYTHKVPDVFGLNYESAIDILEGEGFTVTAKEADVHDYAEKFIKSIGKNTKSVKKGEVFNVAGYMEEESGEVKYENFDKNYPSYYSLYVYSKNKAITIYYADDDYNVKSDKNEKDTKSTEENSSEVSESEYDWEDFIYEYEEWVDEYIELMEEYKEDPTDADLLTEYTEMLGEMADWTEKAEEVEASLADASAEELAEYTSELARIANKLAEAAY